MKKVLLTALALIMSLAILAGCGSSSDDNEESKSYVIATDTTFAPFEFTNEDNEFV